MGLSNSQYNAVMREYEALQAEDRRELAARRERVFRAVPELKALDKQAGISAMRRFLDTVQNGKEDAGAGFSDEVRAIEEKKRTLLLRAGFAADELEPRYHCPVCRDTGLVNGEKCGCFRARSIKLLYENSKLNRILERENFGTFSLRWYDDRKVLPDMGKTERQLMEEILGSCRDFTENFREQHGSMLFMGSTGVGKTFLCNCIAKDLMDRGQAVVYLTAPELIDCAAKVQLYKTEDLAVRGLYEYIFSCDLLIIDDLGTEPSNAFSASQIFSILNARLGGEKGTLISTNLTLRSMRDLYTERTTSRITSSYAILTLCGSDIRCKKRLEDMENRV